MVAQQEPQDLSEDVSCIGKRLSFEGHLCTVRHIGPLEGTRGLWLGVEWDDPTRGKHNGSYEGKSVFKCASAAVSPASFIRPARRSDSPRTIMDALRVKYHAELREHGWDDKKSVSVEISGKTVEEIGFEKISKQQAMLENIRIAVLDQLHVCGLVQRGSSREDLLHAQDELRRTCPNVVELDVSGNLMETFQDLVDIVCALPKLRSLRAR